MSALDFVPSIGVTPLTDRQRRLLSVAHELGETKLAPRAREWDDTATFPFANYADLRDAGFLALCIPEAQGGQGADYATYCMVAAELGRFCGATALTFNMHSCMHSRSPKAAPRPRGGRRSAPPRDARRATACPAG